MIFVNIFKNVYLNKDFIPYFVNYAVILWRLRKYCRTRIIKLVISIIYNRLIKKCDVEW